jgi:hypothetical protein
MNAEAVRVRVGNRSQVDFDRVVVGFPSGDEDYGRVPAGGRSDYREVTEAYAYASIDVSIKGTTMSLRAMDYVGEQALAPGNYTYAVSHDPAAGSHAQLQLSLVVD